MTALISGSKLQSQSQLERESASEFQEITFEAAKGEFPTEAWDSIMEVHHLINQSSSASVRYGKHSSNPILPVIRKRETHVPDMSCAEGIFGGAWCARLVNPAFPGIRPDRREYIVLCGAVGSNRFCEADQVCVTIDAADGHPRHQTTVVCEDIPEIDDVGSDEDVTVYTGRTHTKASARQIAGTSTTKASIKSNKGQNGRHRAVAITAFILTANKPFEASQPRWLVQPKLQSITCALEKTGEKLCETDVSSSSKNPYTCESTNIHIIEETAQIDCSFKLAATQVALFVYVVVWRDSIAKSIVG
ncbi:hypothetical protein BCR37DRAFT_388605 [Protomyces lactucae-debilis]|uniref:Uncharacterized protein n=1 Tax=Protomyces lactucae-debilis TaxID=2754530 RepID=A0A1Y2F507_PROLT|nr:uncharacterized protein BCR37DRAFT_388605 [Protomyces lactucae-debilis]ORY78990.1 hypothetical protein BCR37DRAFT_388605 [Protomyces lactucae-debilis]